MHGIGPTFLYLDQTNDGYTGLTQRPTLPFRDAFLSLMTAGVHIAIAGRHVLPTFGVGFAEFDAIGNELDSLLEPIADEAP